MGMQVVREFNLSDERLWLLFLKPLMADQPFTVEGHEYTPRHTRLTVYEGPELRPDQLSFGRGWQSVERSAEDVTDRVLQRAREYTAGHNAHAHSTPPAGAELVRERLLGRIAAGPIPAQEILAIATELMPDSTEQQRVEAGRQAAWELLERGAANLSR